MNVPNLSWRLERETPVRVTDDTGGFTTTWQPLGVHWAEVKASTGREFAGVAMPISRVVYRITVRGAPNGSTARPRAGQRFVDGARRFAILAVTERDAAARYLTCQCQEEVVG